jgi:hypothetical protein
MMKTDRTKLKEVLGEADNQYGLIAELEPFFKNTDEGQYPLSPASEDLRAEALAVLRGLFGEVSASKVAFVSLSNPFPKPEWMTHEVYKSSLLDSFRDSLRVSLGSSLLDSLRVSFRDSLRASLLPSLGSSLLDSLRDNLLDSMEASLTASFWDSIWDILGCSLFYFLRFAIAGKAEGVEKLRPLIRLLPKAIPLGLKKDDLGTWLVLVD